MTLHIRQHLLAASRYWQVDSDRKVKAFLRKIRLKFA